MRRSTVFRDLLQCVLPASSENDIRPCLHTHHSLSFSVLYLRLVCSPLRKAPQSPTIACSESVSAVSDPNYTLRTAPIPALAPVTSTFLPTRRDVLKIDMLCAAMVVCTKERRACDCVRDFCTTRTRPALRRGRAELIRRVVREITIANDMEVNISDCACVALAATR